MQLVTLNLPAVPVAAMLIFALFGGVMVVWTWIVHGEQDRLRARQRKHASHFNEMHDWVDLLETRLAALEARSKRVNDNDQVAEAIARLFPENRIAASALQKADSAGEVRTLIVHPSRGGEDNAKPPGTSRR